LPPGKQKNDYGFDFWIFIDYWNHLLDIYDCNIADDLSAKKMTTFTTDDRQNVQTLLFENANKIVELQEKIKFLETKNKWLMQQVEQLEIQIWGSR